MRAACVIQARMGSTRFPGKVLQAVGDDTMLARVIQAAKAMRHVSDVLVAVPANDANERLEFAAQLAGVGSYAGPEEDVLGRFMEAVNTLEARPWVIVRVTADCPLLDPEASALVVERLLSKSIDYVSNQYPPGWPENRSGFPDGVDTEAFTYDALVQAWTFATEKADREHVTPWMRRNLRCDCVRHEPSYSHLKWSVDTPADLAEVRRLWALKIAGGLRRWQEVADAGTKP